MDSLSIKPLMNKILAVISMNLPKKVNYLLFLFLITLALSFRAGYIYQHGGDTWATCTNVIIISDKGCATWILNPLSFFGWYPFSYPTGEFLFLSALEQTTAQNIKFIAYVGSTFIGVFGIFTVYLLARQIKDDDMFAFIVVIIFATFEKVILSTWNNISTRGLFITLYPIVILFLLKARSDKKHRPHFVALAFIATIALSSIHRNIILFFGTILLPYILLLPINHSWMKHNMRFPYKTVTFFMLSLIFIIFLLQIFDYTIVDVSRPSYEKHLFPGDNPFFKALNLSGDYGIRYNISAIFAPFGLIAFVLIPKKKFGEKYLILITSISILFILDLEYFLIFFCPIVSLLVGHGLFTLFRSINKDDKKLFLPFCLMSIIISTQFLNWYIEKGYYLLVPIWILGIILIIWGIIKSFYPSSPKRVFAYILIGLILICASFASAISQFKSWDLMNQAEKGEGKIADETRFDSSAFWLREYGTTGWVADGPAIRLPLWAISRVPTAANYLAIVDNAPLRAELNPEFNLSYLWETQKHVFEYEVSYRHNPDYVEDGVIYGNNQDIAKKYHVDWVIFTNSGLRGEGKKIVSFLKEERYSIYRDSIIVMFHYASGE